MMDVFIFSVHKVGLSISGITAQMLFSIEKDQASESQLLVMLMVTETLKSSFQKRISFMSWHMLVSIMTFWIQKLFLVFIFFSLQAQRSKEETDVRAEVVETMDIQREWALLSLFFSLWHECFYKHQSESYFFNQTDLQYNQSEQSSNQ